MRDRIAIAAFIDACYGYSRKDLLPLCGSEKTLEREKDIDVFKIYLTEKKNSPKENRCNLIQRFYKCPCEKDEIDTQIGRSFDSSFDEIDLLPINANIEIMRNYTGLEDLDIAFEGCPWFLLNDETVQSVRIFKSNEELFGKANPKETPYLIYNMVTTYNQIYNTVVNRLISERQKKMDEERDKSNKSKNKKTIYI